jgi:hypothetical protein
MLQNPTIEFRSREGGAEPSGPAPVPVTPPGPRGGPLAGGAVIDPATAEWMDTFFGPETAQSIRSYAELSPEQMRLDYSNEIERARAAVRHDNLAEVERARALGPLLDPTVCFRDVP